VHDRLTIRTPENVAFHFELAGIGSRALAFVVDAAAMGSMLLAVGIVLSIVGVAFTGLAMALYFVAAFVVQWGYAAGLELAYGRTLGKRVAGIRVVQQNGLPITPAQAAIRNLVRIVDMLPVLYLTGGACALIDARGRRLGDLAAGTVVVRTRHAPRPAAVLAPVERHNSFARDPAVVQACARITAPERDAMLGLALRREQLPLAVRHALFAKLSSHLESRVGLERPSYLSEERFVLNLAAVALSPALPTSLPTSAAGPQPG
jgi:uncharacterized RDD family membrane protein YckC